MGHTRSAKSRGFTLIELLAGVQLDEFILPAIINERRIVSCR
jgi:hypothetical protein